MIPFALAAGLLGAASAYQKYTKDQAAAQRAQAIQGLLGQRPEVTPAGDEMGNGYAVSGGSGLLANPNDPRRQFDFAAGLAANPQLAEQGLRMLESTYGRTQQAQQFGQQQAQGAEQFAQSQAGIGERFQQGRADQASNEQRMADQWLAQFQAQQEQRDYQRQRDAMGDQRAQQAAAAAAAAAAQGKPVTLDSMLEARGYTKAPAGMQWYNAPNGQFAVRPVPGTEAYGKATGGLAASQQAVTALDDLVDVFAGPIKGYSPAGKPIRDSARAAGTETFDTPVAARMSALRGQVIAAVGKAREAGVLDKAEYERFEAQVGDPTGWTSGAKRNSTILESWLQTREELQAKVDAHLRANPWLLQELPPPPPGTVPYTPETARPPPGAGRRSNSGSW